MNNVRRGLGKMTEKEPSLKQELDNMKPGFPDLSDKDEFADFCESVSAETNEKMHFFDRLRTESIAQSHIRLIG